MEGFDDTICRKFLKNPTKNPRSGRNISKGKDIYKGLVKLCKEILMLVV